MRTAFLNPMFGRDFTKSARWFARSRGRVQRHPDYLCTAAAVVERDGHEVFFLDAQAKNLPLDAYLDSLRVFGPGLVVHQASTPSIDADIATAGRVKETTGALQVLVGPHVTAEPEDTLRRADGAVDAVCLGEYDFTVRDLARGVPVDACAGLARLDNGRFARNARRPLIDDLDSLPFPAWHHIDINDYRDAGKLFPFLTLISGRGCWGRCTFCQLPQTMTGQHYRPRGIDNVLAEIEFDLKCFPGLREVMFEDDTLLAPANRERLHALCEALIRRDFGIAWSANGRVDGGDLETLRLMKRAGCRMLCVGFEFGDQTVLDAVKKGTTVEQMRRFAEDARKSGIRIHGCFMFGGPGENRETARKTIALATSLPVDTAQFSGVVAYPGTEYYAWARKHGYIIPAEWRGWVDGNYEQVTTQSLPDLSAEDINALIDEGLRAFYLRPSQMARMLLNIRSMSDVKAKWHGLRAFFGYFGGKEARPPAEFTGNN